MEQQDPRDWANCSSLTFVSRGFPRNSEFQISNSLLVLLFVGNISTKNLVCVREICVVREKKFARSKDSYMVMSTQSIQENKTTNLCAIAKNMNLNARWRTAYGVAVAFLEFLFSSHCFLFTVIKNITSPIKWNSHAVNTVSSKTLLFCLHTHQVSELEAKKRNLYEKYMVAKKSSDVSVVKS